MTRLFVAIDPPSEVRTEIAAVCSGIDGARWVPAAQFHVTLRFLGEVEPEQAGRIASSLESVRHRAFTVAFARAGRFPPRRSPRVIWVGLEPEEPLISLHDGIESALRSAGIAADEKPFSPHLTIARLREDASRGAVERWLETWSAFGAGPFSVSEFSLYSSVLGPAGAQHRKVASYDLKGAEP